MTGSCENTAACKILVIDDDTLVRRTLCMTLAKMGYAVVEAPTGQMGIVEFKKENPDIVITDVMMPDKNGLETISELRAINPAVRIVAMSGNGPPGSGTDLLDLALDVGAVATLNKPFTIEAIRDVLDNLPK